MTQTRKWSLLAVLLTAAIFVASWFLLIGPQRSDAKSLQAQNKSAEAANAALTQQLDLLKAQSQEVPAQQARLAQLRRKIPDNPALPALIRDLTASGNRSGVQVVAMEPQAPVAVVDQTATAAPATTTTDSATTDSATTDSATTGSESTSGSSSEGESLAAAPAAPQAVLFQVPLGVTVSGDYFEIVQFVNKLEGLKRSFLVTGYTLTVNDAAAAEDPADQVTAPLTLTLQGRVFISPEATAVQSAPTATAAPAANAE